MKKTVVLDKFRPRSYQYPLIEAIEQKGYKRVLAILPRRAGKDITAWNLCIRQCLKKSCVVYYIFPTYSQGRKVIWDSITNTGERFIDYIPADVIESINSQEMKIRFINGSLLQVCGSDNVDCFCDATEILTDQGWKLFKDLDKTESVASLENGNFVWSRPTAYVEYEYSGDMYCVSNSGTDFMVTPNHRFFVKSGKGVYKFKHISDPTIRSDMVPSTCQWIGEHPETIMGYKSEPFVALVGLYLAEGSVYRDEKNYRVIISQIKPSVRSVIKELLMEAGIKATEDKNGFVIHNKQLYEYFVQLGKQPDRFIPAFIKNLSKDLLHILFEYMVLGDGNRSGGRIKYYSTSKRLIDDAQEIIIKLGLSGNISIKPQQKASIKGRVINSKRILYQLLVRTSRFKRFVGPNYTSYIHTIPYAGKVYCVSVPSGVIKVRRNGKEMWSGNSLVGTNPQAIVFSEYALQDPRAYQFLRPILVANGGWALFISTPRGKSHLWDLYQIARKSPDWFCLKLSVEDTRHISLEEIDKERQEGIMSEDMIQQEYYTSFDMGVEGSYYQKYMDSLRLKGQITLVPWEPGFKVSTAWDLGVRDSTCIIFFQSIGSSVRIIDYYEKNKEGLEHYAKVLQNKPYVYGKHIAPHDIAVREFGSGMTRIDKARQLGITFTIAPDLSIMDGIEAVRSTLPRVFIDEVRCAQLIKALENYRQEYDHKRKVYKNNPLHNEFSHAADAMRYLAISLAKVKDGSTPQELQRRYMETVYGAQSNLPSVFRDDLPRY